MSDLEQYAITPESLPKLWEAAKAGKLIEQYVRGEWREWRPAIQLSFPAWTVCILRSNDGSIVDYARVRPEPEKPKRREWWLADDDYYYECRKDADWQSPDGFPIHVREVLPTDPDPDATVVAVEGMVAGTTHGNAVSVRDRDGYSLVGCYSDTMTDCAEHRAIYDALLPLVGKQVVVSIRRVKA